MPFIRRTVVISVVTTFVLAALAARSAAETLCDPSFQNCRTPLLTLIDNENVGIDVGFWFMTDDRYVSHIIARWNAGVPVRIIVDPRANPTNAGNSTSLDEFQAAGIPMIQKAGAGIMHWKMMLFAGQETVEFGSANFSPFAFVPVTPYTNYVGESVFFEDDPVVVDSFKRKFDDVWVDTSNYSSYANISSRVRVYPTYTISPDMNFPPGQSFANRVINGEKAETQRIDVDMYRITQQSHGDALIAAHNRGVPVRYFGETVDYRNASRLWVAWNMDRMYAAGIPMRVRASQGQNHEKMVLLYGQAMAIFGSSNFTSPSDNYQLEHNYFTTKSSIFQFFQDQFNRKWNNSTGNAESGPFVPLPPDPPQYRSPANGATGVPTTGQTLVWYGGPWAHLYDVYFGTAPNPTTPFASNQALGPSETTSETQSFTLPTLQPGTTYYWKIVSKTAAYVTAGGPVWSFTTTGTPPPPSNAPDVVLWGANVPSGSVHGNWQRLADSSAAGGVALWNPNSGQSKISPALSNPANYFEDTFSASSGTAYHLWLRMRAENDSTSNDSVHVQFSDSVDGFGTPVMRIGTTSSAEVVLQDGSSDPGNAGWGWSDNGWGTLGANIYFATTGTHTVRVQQREDGAIVDQIVLSPDTYLSSAPGANDNDATILSATDGGTGGGGGGGGALPSGWQTSDIGAVGLAGAASYSSGTFTVTGSGADIWGNADAFRYAYYQLPGDGTIVARVATVQNVSAWTKAGVMIRQSLDASSAQASMFVTPGKGLAFQRRQTAGGASVSTSVSGTAPRWVMLTRAGQQVTAYVSSNGSSWSTVGQDTIALSGPVWVGLAVSSHDNSQLATATFDGVSISQPAAPLPSGWSNTDVGSVGVAGASSYSGGTFTVAGSGADIWGTADAFQFAYRTLSGDGQLVARVASLTDTNRWSKAGVMIRDGLAANAAYALMLVSAENGTALQYRTAAGATAASVTGTTNVAPFWLKIVRSADVVSAYQSGNGSTWQLVGSVSIPMSASVEIGLAVTSHDNTKLATATFDNVS